MAATRTGQEKRLAARVLRGAVGGILAGMVFAGVTMWFADSTGGTASMPRSRGTSGSAPGRLVNRPMSRRRGVRKTAR